MTDIVERLRALANPVADEAAKTIEDMREVLKDIEDMLNRDAEIVRLSRKYLLLSEEERDGLSPPQAQG